MYNLASSLRPGSVGVGQGQEKKNVLDQRDFTARAKTAFEELRENKHGWMVEWKRNYEKCS